MEGRRQGWLLAADCWMGSWLAGCFWAGCSKPTGSDVTVSLFSLGSASFSEALTGVSSGTAAERSFFFRNSSFLLSFLLRVEGVTCFLVTVVAGVSFTLVSREKVKEEPMVRVKVKVFPWLVSAWQRSRHLVDRGWSPVTTTGAAISVGFI